MNGYEFQPVSTTVGGEQLTTSRLSAGRRWLLSGLVIGLLIAITPTGRVVLATAFWLIAPGYLLERYLPSVRLHWLLRIALWVGIGLSILPIVYLWITAIGGAVTPFLLIGGAFLLAISTGVAAWHDLAAVHDRPSAATWVLLTIFVITAGLRAVQIADLAFPPWVDSVHHALMIRVAAETGRVPWTLTPYLPVVDMPYHWGYHVLIAAAWQLSGGELPDVMLWSGQFLNWLQSVTAAALALLYWRRPVAVSVAAVIVGCISWMPAYYVSWGRYTQLSGLLLLVSLAISWHYWLHTGDRRERIGWLALIILTATGLSLVHMRVFVFGGALIAADSLVWCMRQSRRTISIYVGLAGLVGVGIALLAAPWWWLILRRILLPAAVGEQSLTTGGSYARLSYDLMWIGPNEWLVALALLGALLGVARRQRATTILTLWVGGLVVLTNPWLISFVLPSVGVIVLIVSIVQRRWRWAGIGLLLLAINPATVHLPFLWLLPVDIAAISLFLPLSSLIGGGAALIWPSRRWLQIGGACALIGIALWGAQQQRNIVNPITVLATADDRLAMRWIGEHTPTDARFLINAAPWLPTIERGNDGGWWITPLTGRWTSTPPVLITYGDPTVLRVARQLSQHVIAIGNGQPIDLVQLITDAQIDYIYTSPAGPLTPAQIAGLGYEPVYVQGSVVIYQVRAP